VTVLVRHDDKTQNFFVDPGAAHGFVDNLSWEKTREERKEWIKTHNGSIPSRPTAKPEISTEP
jgi:hypothetical protein